MIAHLVQISFGKEASNHIELFLVIHCFSTLQRFAYTYLRMESNHRFFATILLVMGFIFFNNAQMEDGRINATNTENSQDIEKLHLFLVAIPESSVSDFMRLRQDEDDPPDNAMLMSFAQTGQQIGQIIQGVLGGDFRRVFAGSLGFVQEPMANSNLGSFLGTIAPGLNLAFRELYNRAAIRLGFRQTTPKPVVNVPQKPAEPTIQEIVYGSNPKPIASSAGRNNNTVSTYHGNDIINERGGEDKGQNLPPSSTTSWQFVLNQIYSETSTVQPLPLITRFWTTITPEDEDYDAKRLSKD